MSKILRWILWVLFLTHPLLLVCYHYLVVNFCNYRNFCAAPIIQESSIVNPALFAKTRIKTRGEREERQQSSCKNKKFPKPIFFSFRVIFKLSGFSFYTQSKKCLDFSVPNKGSTNAQWVKLGGHVDIWIHGVSCFSIGLQLLYLWFNTYFIT